MRGFDPDRAAAHRVAQAHAGWPLLRGCASTFAIRRLGYLDTLPPAAQVEVAVQMGAFEADELASPPATNAERAERMAAYPALKAYTNDLMGGNAYRGIGRLPVKVVAGLREDAASGGIAGWARTAGLEPALLVPPAGLAGSLDELVPVRPQRLRTLMARTLEAALGATTAKLDATTTRHVARVDGCDVVVDVVFAAGGRPGTHQFDYWLRCRTPSGATTRPLRYEGVLQIAGRWDYVTEANAERSVQHLATVVRACVALVGD